MRTGGRYWIEVLGAIVPTAVVGTTADVSRAGNDAAPGTTSHPARSPARAGIRARAGVPGTSDA